MIKDHDFEKFEKMTEPIMKWLTENYSPYHSVIITADGAKVVQDCFFLPRKFKEEEI